MLQALNIPRTGPVGRRRTPDVIHRQVETLELAFADRFEYIEVPDRTDIPVEELLSDEYAAAQRGRIDLANAARLPIEAGLERQLSNTTTFHITDAESNEMAVTASLGG